MQEFRQIATECLDESPLNPRKRYDAAALKDLADSIRAVGVIEPLVVRPGATENGKAKKAAGERLEVIAGSRRLRAAKLAELADVPARVMDLDDTQALEIMVVENNQREDVNALEEAEGYHRLMERGYDREKLAAKIGRSTKYIYDRLKLMELTPEAKKLLLSGKLQAGHAILLARLSPADQRRTLDPQGGGAFQVERQREFGDDEPETEGKPDPFDHYKAVSVRELDEWIDRNVRLDRKAPIVQDLFSDTAAAVSHAEAEQLKVIQITKLYMIPPDAKEGDHERIYTERSWKLADGTGKHKRCDRSVLGVIVVGPGRGESHQVCIHKACKVHWDTPAAAKAKKAQASRPARSGDDYAARQQKAWEREEAERKRWKDAAPALHAAFETAIAKAKPAVLVRVAMFGVSPYEITEPKRIVGTPKTCEELLRLAALCFARGQALGRAFKALGTPKSPEDLVRLIALARMMAAASEYNARIDCPRVAGLLGLDARKIVAAQLKPDPVQTAAPTPAKAKTKTKARKRAARKA